MGKDAPSKNTTSRLYSPWQLDDNETWVKKSHRFGLTAKDDDFEVDLLDWIKNATDSNHQIRLVSMKI